MFGYYHKSAEPEDEFGEMVVPTQKIENTQKSREKIQPLRVVNTIPSLFELEIDPEDDESEVNEKKEEEKSEDSRY